MTSTHAGQVLLTAAATIDPEDKMTTRSILTLSQLLRRERERILHEWTQHAPARTASGTMCGANDPAAIAWCAAGAAWYSDDTVPDNVNDPCYSTRGNRSRWWPVP